LLISQGKKKEGILLLKRSISGLGEEPVHQSDSKAMLATYILQDMIDPLKIIYNNFSTEEKTDFEEARVLFTEAWAGIKDSELAPARWYIVLNRGVIYKLTGEKNMALLDFQKAYDLSKDFLAFKNLLMMHVQLGNLTLAEELLSYSTFNKPLTPEEQTDINIIRSRLLCLAGKFREAIGILSSELDEESPDNYCDFVATIISIYFERGLLEEAEPWCNDLQGKFPGLAIGYVFSGFLFLKRGEKEKALKNFDQAQELFTESTPISDMFQLASGYVDLENYEKALPLFEKIATPNLLNDFSRGLVYTQYRLGNLREALFLAEGLFDVNPKNSFLAEIIANIYEESKNYDRAIEVLEQFSQTALGSVKDLFLYRSAKLYAYKRDWDAVIRLTEQINDPCLLSLENIFILANILIKAGNEVRGMDIAYVARTRYFDQSESHLKYINTSILIKKESAELYPLVVPTECAVFIRTDSGKEEVLLITIKETKGDNVLKPNDPFARQLIGKAVNDELIIHKSYGIQYRVLIIAVMDIFVYAFRESLRLFETRFAGRHNLDVFKANPGQPDDQMEQVIKTASSERNNFQRQVYELYNQKKATVGMLASLFKRNIVQEWLSLISSSDVKMISYSHNEYPFIEQAVSRKKPLIIDLTALLTMFFMSPDKNFFQLLENQYVVSQSTVDELNVFCEELDSYAEEGMTSVGYVDGRMTIQSISKEDILKQRERITAIIDWCHSNTQIKIPTSQLTINRQIRKQHAELLGDSFYDTILLAKEQEGTVVSDDATFKNLLASSYSIESFSCYQLANYLGTQSLLSKEYYQKFTFQLIIANYIFIPVTSDQLWAAFDMAGFQLQRPFTVAVKGLTIMTAPYCAAAIIFFLKKLYLHAGLTVTRQQTAFLLLHEASQKADFSYIKNLLIAGIEKEFKLLPTCKDEVLAMINEF
jgi:tetratricopeptide (TPR) repeat protein